MIYLKKYEYRRLTSISLNGGPTEAALRQRFGEFCAMENQIRVLREGQTSAQVMDTLIHEVNHAIFWAHHLAGAADNEEHLVTIMATAWVQIYRDNPKLLKCITELTAEMVNSTSF